MARSKVDSSDFLKFMENEEDSQAVPFSPSPSKRPEVAPQEVAAIESQSVKANKTKISKTTEKPRINYGTGAETKSTEELRTNSGKSTDQTNGLSTDILRKNYGSKNVPNSKTTDKPTDKTPDDLRIKTGKPTDVLHLVGFQRAAFFWIVNQAKNLGSSDGNGNRITPPINGNTFASSVLFKSYKQAKDILYELKVSGFLHNHYAKHGRGGFVQYLIERETYQACLLAEGSAKSTDYLRTNTGKPTDITTDKPTEAALSSGIRDSKNLNTNTGDAEFVIPENLRLLGVGQKNLRSILNDGALSVEEIQGSLDQFSHDLTAGVVKKNPLNLLMGILRKKNVYISASYTQQTERDLAEHLARIAAYEENKNKLAEAKRADDFSKYLESNPEFLDEVRKTIGGGSFNLSEEMVRKMAFSRWSESQQDNSL